MYCIPTQHRYYTAIYDSHCTSQSCPKQCDQMELVATLFLKMGLEKVFGELNIWGVQFLQFHLKSGIESLKIQYIEH